MKKLFLITLSLFWVVLSGCTNQFKFRAKDLDETPAITPAPDNSGARVPDPSGGDGNPKPEVPPISDPDVEPGVYPITHHRGDCTKDNFAVLPCFSCQITMKPISLLSKKAQQLATIMEQGCQIPNKSDPTGYFPPTRDEILKYLNQATSSMYPDSTPTTRQRNNLNSWIANDPKALAKLFGGLWYNPPYSDDFETYFGLEPKEARYYFCYGKPAGSFSPLFGVSPLYSINYYQCIQESGLSSACREQSNYVQANVYRKQLATAIVKSLTHPANIQEMVPANRCHWESMTGVYNVEMDLKVQAWKAKGYEMAVYYQNDQPRCEAPLKINSIPLYSRVVVAGKLCTDF